MKQNIINIPHLKTKKKKNSTCLIQCFILIKQAKVPLLLVIPAVFLFPENKVCVICIRQIHFWDDFCKYLEYGCSEIQRLLLFCEFEDICITFEATIGVHTTLHPF